MKPGYLIIDLVSGLMDGVYFDEATACDVRLHHEKERPQGEWIAVRVVAFPEHGYDLPDHLFWGRSDTFAYRAE